MCLVTVSLSAIPAGVSSRGVHAVVGVPASGIAEETLCVICSFAFSGLLSFSPVAFWRSETFKKKWKARIGQEQTTVAEDGLERWPRHWGWPRCLLIQY